MLYTLKLGNSLHFGGIVTRSYTGANRRLVDARNALQRMQQANAMIPDAVGSMLALADPAAADAAAALMNLSGTGHCSDTILAGAGLTVY